jgi:hypothetical protein
VGPGIEFPSGTLFDKLTGTYLIGANTSIGMSTIDTVFTQYATALSAPFNGGFFDFSGATILSATLAPTSTFTPSQVLVTFGPHFVAINTPGLSFTPSSNILVDLTFTRTSTPTPEPQPWMLISGGLTLLGFVLLRRRSAVQES